MFDHPRTTTSRIENFSGSRALSMVRRSPRRADSGRGDA
jgi:hypothetical protein